MVRYGSSGFSESTRTFFSCGGAAALRRDGLRTGISTTGVRCNFPLDEVATTLISLVSLSSETLSSRVRLRAVRLGGSAFSDLTMMTVDSSALTDAPFLVAVDRAVLLPASL